jgi:hypothetical protein
MAHTWYRSTFGCLPIGQDFYWGPSPEPGEVAPRRKVDERHYFRPAGQGISALLIETVPDQEVYILVDTACPPCGGSASAGC